MVENYILKYLGELIHFKIKVTNSNQFSLFTNTLILESRLFPFSCFKLADIYFIKFYSNLSIFIKINTRIFLRELYRNYNTVLINNGVLNCI